jgi:hypothetical protein
VWRGCPVDGDYITCWVTGVVGVMLKAAWQWGSDSSVINDPLGEPGHTPLYVGLLYMHGSVGIRTPGGPKLLKLI